MLKNKKGLIGITIATTAGLIVFGVIILMLILGFGVFLSWITRYFLLVIGAAIIILGMIFGVAKSRNPLKVLIIVLLIGGAVIALHYSGLIRQEAFIEEAYFEAPFFGTVHCAQDRVITSGEIEIGMGRWITCPDNSKECTIFLTYPQRAWYTTERRVEFYRCDDTSYTNCDSPPQYIENIPKSGISGVEIYTLKTGDVLRIEVQKRKVPFGWKTTNDERATYYLRFESYIIYVENALGGGESKMSGSKDCIVPLSSVEWVNRIISSTVRDEEGKSAIIMNKNQLEPDERYNFIAGTITRATYGNTIDYKGERGYCAENVQGEAKAVIYGFGQIKTESSTYNIVDVNHILGREECCREGEVQLNRVCRDYNWEEIEIDEDTGETDVDCDLFNPCNPGRFILNQDERTSFIYRCIDGSCVISDIQEEECVSNQDCKTDEACINYKCEKVSTIPGVDSTLAPLSQADCRWYQDFVSTQEKRYSWYNYIGIGEPEIVPVNKCVTSTWVYLVIAGGFLVIIIVVLLLVGRKPAPSQPTTIYPPAKRSRRRK